MDIATRQILESMPTPFIIYRPRTHGEKILLASDGFCQMMGYTREDFVKTYSQKHGNILHPHDVRKMVDMETYGALHPAEPLKGVLRLKTANGKYKWISGYGVPKEDDDESVAYYINCTDVTEYWEYQEAHRKSTRSMESLIHNILDTANSAIFWKDNKSHYIGANKTFLNFCGISLEELIGKSSYDLDCVPDQSIIEAEDSSVFNGTPLIRSKGTLKTPQGTIEILVSKSPLKEGRKVVGLVGSIEDVTSLNSQQVRLDELTTILDNLSVGVVVYSFGTEGVNFITTNSALCNMLNIEKNSLSKDIHAIDYLIHPADKSQLENIVRRIIDGEQNLEYIYRIYPAGETSQYLWIKTTTQTGQTKNNQTIVYSTFVDITAEKIAEQALDEAQEAYKSAADSAGLVVWKYNIADGTKTFLNNKVSQHIRSKLNLKNTISHEEDAEAKIIDPVSRNDYFALNEAVRHGESSSCDIQLAKTDPSQPIHWERLTYSVSTDNDGNPTVGYGIGMDITQEKLRELQYNQELHQLHNVTQSNLIDKCHFDLTDNVVLDYVPSQSPHTIPMNIGDNYDIAMMTLLSMIINPDERQKVVEVASKETLLHKFMAGERTFSIEYSRQNEDMSPVLVETTFYTFSGKTGHVECFMYSYDMTHKFIGQIIADKISELGYTQMGIINIITGTMTYYSRNRGVVESTAANPLIYEELMNRQLRPLLGNKAADELMDNISISTMVEKLARHPIYEYSFDVPRSNDSLSRIRLQSCYLDRSHTSIFIAQSDITEQYRQERQQLEDLHKAILAVEKANDSKSMFLSSISHDMRTPLNGILSFTDFAIKTDDTEKRLNYLNKIKQSGSLLLNLINDTLNLTRLESGKVTVEAAEVEFQELLDTITTSIDVAAHDRGIHFVTDIDTKLPTNIRIDKLKIQEICLNLLSNAVKFTKPEGTVKLSMSFMPDVLLKYNEQELPQCQIIVEDNGIGISSDFLPKLFEPFTQEQSTEVKNPTGTGLGLSIVKRYIAMMGGTIDVTSRLGKGTTFTVNLPWEAIDQTGSADHVIKHAMIDFTDLSILLVEDNILNQEIASTLLEAKGAKLAIANNGREAVSMFAEAPPNTYQLILMDIRMPVMNGYDAAATIRHMPRKDAKRIPIIAMTADAYENDIKHCLSVGMNSHVVKPINPEVLFSEISRLCKK